MLAVMRPREAMSAAVYVRSTWCVAPLRNLTMASVGRLPHQGNRQAAVGNASLHNGCAQLDAAVVVKQDPMPGCVETHVGGAHVVVALLGLEVHLPYAYATHHRGWNTTAKQSSAWGMVPVTYSELGPVA